MASMLTTNGGPMITAGNVDLNNCDREQIQFSGAVQPHGALLVLSERDLLVLQASANCPALLGTPAIDRLLGQPIEHALGQSQAGELRDRLQREAAGLGNGPVHVLRAALPGGVFDTFAHRVEGGLIIEFEVVAAPAAPLLDLYSDLRSTIARLQATHGLQAFFALACDQTRRFTGYERVMAYKFLEDGSGDVTAESLAEGLQPYLGMRFPATDIPAPARRLFALSWLRHLPDTNYQPVALLPEQAAGGPLDQSRGLLRSVSVMYTSYLKNMGARGTMVMPLMKDGALWGLISCMNHSAPLHVAYEPRMAAEFLAHMLSLLMAAKEDTETYEYKLRIGATLEHLTRAMAAQSIFHDGLTKGDTTVLRFVDATGAAVATADGVVLLGRTPGEAQVRQLIGWLGKSQTENPVFATDSLTALYPAAAEFEDTAAGVLAARLVPHRDDYVLWFRSEIEQTVHWAGNPDKPMEVLEVDGEIRLTPRGSFALYKQSVTGRSAPWREMEIEAAASLRRAVLEVILRQAEALETANRELSRSNVELDSFAFVASHDLKEPLRGITNYATFLMRSHGEQLDEDGREKLRTVLRLTSRMDDLIESLLHYSRVGRVDMALAVNDLEVILDEALMTLAPRIQETGAQIRRPRHLPWIRCDRVRVRELFANLISNALKYSDAAADRWVEIGWEDSFETPVFYVRDNGIGIDAAQHQRIFQIFRRLHPRDAYGGGSGAGLTIVQRVAERHGGRVWVESAPGEGATFRFTLASDDKAS